MPLSSSDALFIAIAFVVPGYIFVWVRSIFLTRRPLKPQEQVIAYIAISSVNIAICSPIVITLMDSQELKSRPVLVGFLWLITLMVVPTLGGVLLGIAAQREWLHRTLQYLHLRPVHVMPTAWEWQFSRVDGSTWIIVTLKDGSTIFGLFGGGSFASSEPTERDIFIESVYSAGSDDRWVPVGKGVLVPHGEIRCIEFFHPDTQESIDDKRDLASVDGRISTSDNTPERLSANSADRIPTVEE